MALQCLAIIGKTNEPLYLLEILPPSESSSSEENEKPENDNVEDMFGFQEATAKDSLSLRSEFMMHASLDRLDEIIGDQPRWKSRTSADTKWIGLLSPVEESFIYGYVTSTNIKILAMVAGSAEQGREVHLKTLFAKVHNLFVAYTLNPFSQLQQKIDSVRFDRRVREAVTVYNQTNGISWV
mmetsp:Transcript_34734/g.49307  ORF Transcript_34734/g.49307 Transcript_34734/m.49307 type:complete len:182 (+) Transcript_34734:118-663(+)